MDWIRKNFEKPIVVLMGLALLAAAFFLIRGVSGLQETLTSASGKGTGSTEVPNVSADRLTAALTKLDSPAQWENTAPLFNSWPHVEKDGQLMNVLKGDTPLHPPIENDWFFEHGLDIQDMGILKRDVDKDGFSNHDEWVGKSDPNDTASHPPYFTKLRLKEFKQTKFRLKFASYSGDTFQINTVDVRQPSQFLKLGDQIKRTKFKIIKFEEKFEVNPRTDFKEDVSELTLENVETGDQIVLVVTVVANSPDSYAIFKYLWDGSEIEVKKDKEFSLKPDDKVLYKLVSVSDDEAVIEVVETSKQITIPKL